MRSPVGIGNDVTMAITTHDATLSGPASPTSEAMATLFRPEGMEFNANKLTYSVRHQSLAIALKDHDCGNQILHLHAIPDPDDLLATINSSRKAVFSASKVRAQKQELAACGFPSTPMLACADPVSVPLSGAFTLPKNTLTFGLTNADMVAGYLEVASEIAIDGIGYAVGASKKGIRGQLLGWAAKMVAKGLKKRGIGVYKTLTTDGPVDLAIETESPFIRDAAKWTFGPRRDEDGNWSWVSEWQIGGRSVKSSTAIRDGVVERSWDIDANRVDSDGNVSVPIGDGRGGDDRELIVRVGPDGASVTRDPKGKRAIYENNPEDPSRHGRVRIVEDE